jgi:hypothetical protein
MNLTLACVRNPVFAWMIMAATVLFGGVAATRIGISQFPDVDFPTISVSATWEGANPQVIENVVVDILEEALVQVEGVRTISSSDAPPSRSSWISREASTWQCRTCRPRSRRPRGSCPRRWIRRSWPRPTRRISRS